MYQGQIFCGLTRSQIDKVPEHFSAGFPQGDHAYLFGSSGGSPAAKQGQTRSRSSLCTRCYRSAPGMPPSHDLPCLAFKRFRGSR